MTSSDSNRRIIEDWMMSSAANGGIDRYDDLHIDQIDARWSDRSTWIDGGIASLQQAIQIREREGLEAVIALVFSLVSSDKVTGIDFATRDDILSRLEWSPPSLYLFRVGLEPWTPMLSGNSGPEVLAAQLDPSMLFGGEVVNCRCFYLEFSQTQDGYVRSLTLAQ